MNSPQRDRRVQDAEQLQSGVPSIAPSEFSSQRFNFGCAILTLLIVGVMHPWGILGYLYYFLIWITFIYIFDRRELASFSRAYTVNGLLTAIFIAVQIYNYPESYGTTSPLGSQTDDSYFFSLVADDLPSEFETRYAYYLYSHGFTDFIRAVTPFTIVHPLEVIFFLSGIAGVISAYARRYVLDVTNDPKSAKTTYLLCLLCPFLLMHGGAVMVRDTCIAALIILSICCINNARYVSFMACIGLQFWMRPGTALLVLPLYGVLYAADITRVLKAAENRRRVIFMSMFAVCVVASLYYFRSDLEELLEQKTVFLTDVSRSGVINEYVATGGRGAFVWVQQQPLALKLVLAPLYMLLNPFFSVTGVLNPAGFDMRTFLVTVIYPIFAIAVHAAVIAALLSPHPFRQRAFWIFATFMLGCLLVGVYSLQSRHKTIILPLYYVIAGIGFHWAGSNARLVGYAVSATWFIAQVGYAVRSGSL